MRTLATLSALVLVLFVSAWCCPPPANMEGVAFTAGEQINLEPIRLMGTKGKDYLEDGQAPDLAIRYTSHYSPKAMVYVGTYGLSYQEGIKLNCMGVILDPQELTDPYAPLDRNDFDFALAVQIELNWLVQTGVVDLSAQTVDSIYQALADAANGSVQYWTLQKTVLGYNSWYNYDTATGEWSGANGVYGVDDINTVRGTTDGLGCAAVQPEFVLASGSLAGATQAPPHSLNAAGLEIQVTAASKSNLQVASTGFLPANSQIVLRNVFGKPVGRFTVSTASAVQSLRLDRKLANGLYWIEVNTPSGVLRAKSMVMQ